MFIWQAIWLLIPTFTYSLYFETDFISLFSGKNFMQIFKKTDIDKKKKTKTEETMNN